MQKQVILQSESNYDALCFVLKNNFCIFKLLCTISQNITYFI